MRKISMGTTVALVAVALSVTAAKEFPYELVDGWTYYLEGVRAQSWPSCAYRFLSYNAGHTDTAVNLWNGAGVNQDFTLRSTTHKGEVVYTLHARDDRVLVAASDCSSTSLRLLPSAGHDNTTEAFWTATAVGTQPGHFEWRAVARLRCNTSFLGYPDACTSSTPDSVMAVSSDRKASWRAFAASAPRKFTQPASTHRLCADPFAWFAEEQSEYRLTCTGGWIPFFSSTSLNTSTVWNDMGTALDPDVPPPAWANSSNRWAPESRRRGDLNFMIVSIEQPSGTHKLGSVVAKGAPDARAYTHYAPNYLPLTELPTGDIDGHLFDDPVTGHTYVVWKTDDNAQGLKYTRIWAQRIVLNETSERIDLLDAKVEILNSDGLWWAPSFVKDGTLVEGPEMLYYDGYYYLFFAAGQYNGPTYTEGVARSLSVTGPFEKMMVPLLSTELVGYDGGKKLQGPGHGAIVQVHNTTYIVVAAHTTQKPLNRKAYIMTIEFHRGWPLAVIPSSP